MRAYRNTTLSFGLVTANVSVYTNKKEHDVKFSLCTADGEAVEQVYRTSKGDIVGPAGALTHRMLPGQTRAIPKEDIDAITAQSKLGEDGRDYTSLTIESFIPVNRIPLDRIDGSYLVGPMVNPKKGGGPQNTKNFATICAAMERKGLAAVCKWVPASRQKMLVMYPENGVLKALCVTFEADMVTPTPEHTAQGVEVSEQEVAMAESLIEMISDQQASCLSTLADESVPKRMALVEKYLDAGTVEKIDAIMEGAPQQAPADDLMAKLKASLDSMKEKAA